MSNASDLTEGLIAGNMSNSQYTAVLKDVRVKQLENYESHNEDGMEKYVYQAYMVEAVVVEEVYGKLPKTIEYIAHRFKTKGYQESDKPYLFSFCQTVKGTYFMPNVMTRIEATQSTIGTAKEIASELKKLSEPVECTVNNGYFLPKNY